MASQEQINASLLLNSQDFSSVELGFIICEGQNFPILETYYLGRFPNAKKSEKFYFDNTITHFESQAYGGWYNTTVFYYNSDKSYFGIPLLYGNFFRKLDGDPKLETYHFSDKESNLNWKFWETHNTDFTIFNFTCIFDKNTIVKWFDNEITHKQLIDNVSIMELYIKTEKEDLVLHLDPKDMDLYAEYIELYTSMFQNCHPDEVSILSAIKGESKNPIDDNNWKGCIEFRNVLKLLK